MQQLPRRTHADVVQEIRDIIRSSRIADMVSEHIGNRVRLTRERVRQIIEKEGLVTHLQEAHNAFVKQPAEDKKDTQD